jgi:transposase
MRLEEELTAAREAQQQERNAAVELMVRFAECERERQRQSLAAGELEAEVERLRGHFRACEKRYQEQAERAEAEVERLRKWIKWCAEINEPCSGPDDFCIHCDALEALSEK